MLARASPVTKGRCANAKCSVYKYNGILPIPTPTILPISCLRHNFLVHVLKLWRDYSTKNNDLWGT